MRSAVEELKKQNINKIIAVGHAGIEIDKTIAKEVDGVDIVVGGHTNTFLYTGSPFKLPSFYIQLFRVTLSERLLDETAGR